LWVKPFGFWFASENDGQGSPEFESRLAGLAWGLRGRAGQRFQMVDGDIFVAYCATLFRYLLILFYRNLNALSINFV